MKTIKKIASVFLAVLFLVSSLGFTVNKMICLKSGKAKISFTKFNDCCKKNKSEIPVVKANCCALNNTSFTLGDYNFVQKNTVSSSINYIAVLNYSNSVIAILKNNPSKIFYSDLPPPLHGRQLLSFISILIL